MNTKRTVIGTLVAMTFVAGWFFLWTWVNAKWPQPEQPQTPAVAVAPAPQPAGVAPATVATSGPASGPTSGPSGITGVAGPSAPGSVPAQAATGGWQVLSSADAKSPAVVQLGSAKRKDGQFALQLNTTAVGAAVNSVVLNDFLRTVDDPTKEPYVFQQGDAANAAVFEQFGKPLATRSITIDGVVSDLSQVVWTLEKQDPAGAATYSITLGTPGKPVLKVNKTYRVFPRKSTERAGAGYDVALDYDFANHSGRPLSVSMISNGPALPPRELDNGPDQRVMAGFRSGANIEVENHYVESFEDETLTRDMAINAEQQPVYWVGVSSVYFQSILMPPLIDDGKGKSSSVRSLKATGLKPDAYEKQPVAITLETAELKLGVNEHRTYPMSVFFGPKWRSVLNEPYYDKLPRDYDQTLVVRAGPCSMCTFDWLINILVAMLGAFHMVARDWGLAIICLVVLVRLALHPITKRSQISMLKMGKMGPEMKRLQEKYKDDKEELQKAMWQFQKQQGITPVLGCLPMFLQMPIWIALWSALNTTFELRHSSFLWGLTWIHDLAKPDRLVSFGQYGFKIPLIGTHFDSLNVLPIMLAFVFYLQQKFTPKPPTMTPEQAQQQKIMQGMMVFLFPLFLYGQPSGLNLYIMTSTGIGIWESRRIRQHIKEKEEAEKAGVLIVDPPPASFGPRGKGKGKGPDGSGGGSGGKGTPVVPQGGPAGWLARKLAELQEKAEQARRQADRRTK